MENYTEPSSIDVDVVMGSINHDYNKRGDTWTSKLSWPNITVKALADEIETLRAMLRREPETSSGVWVVYYGDFSAVAVFATEIEALRHAVENQMTVKRIGWGDIREQIT